LPNSGEPHRVVVRELGFLPADETSVHFQGRKTCVVRIEKTEDKWRLDPGVVHVDTRRSLNIRVFYSLFANHLHS
jgi:hypothetical protein